METHKGYLDNFKLLDNGEIVIKFHVKNMFGKYIDVNKIKLTFVFDKIDDIFMDYHENKILVENIKDCNLYQMARLEHSVSDFGLIFKTNNDSLKNKIFDGDHIMGIMLHESGQVNIVLEYNPNIRKLKLLKIKEKIRDKLSVKNI